MSLGIGIKSTEGIVLAAESRATLEAKPNPPQPGANPIMVSFDNASKVLSFSEPNAVVGAVTYGLAAIGWRTASSFIPEFEATLPGDRLPVQDFAQRLHDFYAQQWVAVMPANYVGPPMTFVVGGYDEGAAYGRVFTFDIPQPAAVVEQHPGPDAFGITWGGQRELVDRLIQGFDPRVLQIVSNTLHATPAQMTQLGQNLLALQMAIPLQAMALQDCVDLAIFFIRTTISGQKLTVGIRGCGGPIDVATITRREGLRWVQRKTITGEPLTFDERSVNE